MTKAARSHKVYNAPASASELAARHRRAAPKRRPRGLPAERRRRLLRPVRAASVKTRAQIARLARRTLALGLAAAIVAGATFAYRAFASSPFFSLRQVDLRGAVHASSEEIRRAVERNVKEGVWQADLSALRGELMRLAWVRDAEVVRVLPDMLRIVITEREPFALARRATGALVWVDREGISLGERSLFKAQAFPPLISGLEEDGRQAASEANRERMILYQQLLDELDRGEPRLSEVVDEVNLGDPQEVRLRLADKRLTVIIGDRDFRPRLEAALKVLDAIARKDLSMLGLFKVTDAERLMKGAPVVYLRATRPDRVIVGLAQ